MNGDKNAITLICRNLAAGPLDSNTEVVVGCPAVYIEHARSLLPAEIAVAGQVIHFAGFDLFIYFELHKIWCLPHFRMLIKLPAVLSPVNFLQLC